MIIISSY